MPFFHMPEYAEPSLSVLAVCPSCPASLSRTNPLGLCRKESNPVFRTRSIAHRPLRSRARQGLGGFRSSSALPAGCRSRTPLPAHHGCRSIQFASCVACKWRALLGQERRGAPRCSPPPTLSRGYGFLTFGVVCVHVHCAHRCPLNSLLLTGEGRPALWLPPEFAVIVRQLPLVCVWNYIRVNCWDNSWNDRLWC